MLMDAKMRGLPKKGQMGNEGRDGPDIRANFCPITQTLKNGKRKLYA
jgi:hypothetical protein